MRVVERRSGIGRVALSLLAGTSLAACTTGQQEATSLPTSTESAPTESTPTESTPTTVSATAASSTTAAAATTATTATSVVSVAGPIAARPSAGCAAAPEVVPGDELITMTSGDVPREYRRHVPTAHDGTLPVPVVVDFHGYSEGAAIHVEMSGLGPYGDEQGFVTITPQGLGAVPRWDVTPGSADLVFVGDLLDDVESTLCVDTARVYVAGLSNGAFMASAIACAYADRVAAIAPVAGIRTIEGCEPARPVPVVAFHGTDDGYVSFDGGLGERAASLPAPDGSGRTLEELGLAGAALEGPSVPEIVADWAARNGCDTPASESAVADDVALVRYPCPQGADVALYRIEGGGHSWPGSAFSGLIESYVGPTTFSIDANEVMWAFFEAHPLALGASTG